MKRIYYLLILGLVLFIGCDKISHNKEEHTYVHDIYFYNELDRNLNLEIFKNKEKINFKLTPNDSVYFGTFSYSMEPNVKYQIFPGHIAYENFLYDIDTLNVLYNSKKYTYTQKDSIRWVLYPDEFWLVVFDEKQKEELGWK